MHMGLVAIKYHEVIGEELGWSRDTGSQDCSQQDQLNVLKYSHEFLSAEPYIKLIQVQIRRTMLVMQLQCLIEARANSYDNPKF